jgi:hypothetical protein
MILQLHDQTQAHQLANRAPKRLVAVYDPHSQQISREVADD